MASARGCRSTQEVCRVAVVADFVSENEFVVAPDSPAIPEIDIRDCFTHGRAANHNCLQKHQAGIRGKLGIQCSCQPGAVKQDCFLWKPFQGRPGANLQGTCHFCQAGIASVGPPQRSGWSQSRVRLHQS